MELENINPHKNRVHKVLAHSYLFYFIVFIFSLFLDYLFPLKIFENQELSFIGIVFFILGTFFVGWAQKSSLKFKRENITKETFYSGPYKYTRSPTHLGLFLLMFGFGVVSNSMFVMVFSVISFIATRLTFIKKEEKILHEKYGQPYMEYKKSVKF